MASSKPGKDVEMNDENLGKIIDVFKPFLLETLHASHLLCLLHIQEVMDVVPMVHMKENSGDFKGASSLLLDAISRSEEPGKWHMFIKALKDVDDTLILDTLLEENDRPDDGWLDNQANRALINLFSQDIEVSLNLENLLPKIVDAHLIKEDDQPRLLAMLREKEKRQANAMLLMLMHRHDRNWYENFLTILYDNEHYRELAKHIDPGFCNKKIEQKRAAQAVESQGASQSQEGAGEFPVPAGHHRPGSSRPSRHPVKWGRRYHPASRSTWVPMLGPERKAWGISWCCTAPTFTPSL